MKTASIIGSMIVTVNVSRPVHLYSRIAYTWWVTAYITGGLMVAISKI